VTNTISRREFTEFLGLSSVAMGLGGGTALASENGDVGWTSDDPHLCGNYLPVEREIDADNLPVTSGRIPLELSGAYMRNGPNPLFKPIYHAYPMDISWAAATSADSLTPLVAEAPPAIEAPWDIQLSADS